MIRVTNSLTIASSLVSVVFAVHQQNLWSLAISVPVAFLAAGVWINREARMAVAAIMLDQVRYQMEYAPEYRDEEFIRAYDELQERRRKWWRV